MPKAFSEYESFDALGLAQLVKQKVISPIELLDAAIECIEESNPRINAVINKMYDQAHETVQRGIPDGIFQGVPFLLKDLLADYAGVSTSQGSRFAQHWVPTRNSEIVDRFIQSGLVVLGKTNTPEFGLSPATEPKLFGPARNPWNENYGTGGSSGGSAAAVAAGMVPMAHGGDGAGSIRIPASYCGVFGFKPTRGRTPSGPIFLREWEGMVVQHVLTRSVRDSAAMLDILSDPELGAPFAIPKPEYSFLSSLDQAPKKLKIAIIEQPFFPSTVSTDYLSALTKSAELCLGLGHEMELKQFNIPVAEVELAFLIVISAELATDIDMLSKTLGRAPKSHELEMATRVMSQAGKHFSAADFSWAIQILDQTGRKLAEFLKNYDVIMSPVTAGAPPLVGQFKPDKIESAILELLRWIPNRAILKRFTRIAATRNFALMPFTPLFNIAGNPAMSVPLFKDHQGLPIGIHFAGRVGEDLLMLQLAAQLEKAKPWIKKMSAKIAITNEMV